MKSRSKRIWLILPMLLLVGICSTISGSARDAMPIPTERFFVNDFADILSQETEDFIFNTSKTYHQSDETQVVVTTVETIGNSSIEEYSLNLGRTWGIGGKEENNGILILLALEEREIRIEVGYGMEGIITDSLSGRIIRGATPMLSEGDYDAGLKQIYTDVIQELEEPGTYEEQHGDEVSWPGVVIIIIVFLIYVFLRSRTGGPGSGRGRIYRHYPYGSYGGRFGGFSGGGFSGGGFSGGGGSFGGGGSSGKF
jgi:uncharacterized protein